MLTLACSGCNIHYSDEVVCTWIHAITPLSIIYTYTTVDNEAYDVYVCALSSTHCSPISDQGTWSCGCSVARAQYFTILSLNSHFSSDAQIETVYCAWTSFMLCTFNVSLHTHVATGSYNCSVGRDFSHGHYSEEGVEGTHGNCLCS